MDFIILKVFSTLNDSLRQPVLPGCGILGRSLFGTTDVVPGTGTVVPVPPATVVQMLQPSLLPHLEIVVRSADTGYQSKNQPQTVAPQVRLLISPIIRDKKRLENVIRSERLGDLLIYSIGRTTPCPEVQQARMLCCRRA